MVQLILVAEKLPAGFAVIGQRRVAQKVDVAPRTKPAPLGMVDNHAFHAARFAPFQQYFGHCVDHVQRQRMQSRGPVQADNARMPLYPGQDVFGHKAFMQCGILPVERKRTVIAKESLGR